jgi:hypothetical protein
MKRLGRMCCLAAAGIIGFGCGMADRNDMRVAKLAPSNDTGTSSPTLSIEIPAVVDSMTTAAPPPVISDAILTTSVQPRDSAGILITENISAAARSASKWQVDTLPTLDIGGSNTDESYQFHKIAGVMQLPAGRVLVVDRSSAALRFYNQNGVFEFRRGGKGNGPGEFQSPQLVPAFGKDSLLLFDSRAGRISVFNTDGQFQRHVYVPRPRGDAVGTAGGSILLFQTIVRFTERPGPYALPASYVLLNYRSGTVDTVGAFPGRTMFMTRDFGPMSSQLSVPFDVMPSAASGPAGFFITAGEAPEILSYDVAGRLRGIVRIVEPVRRVTEAEFVAFAELEAKRHARDAAAVPIIRHVYLQMPRPSIMPAFDALLVDDTGWLWARTFRPDEQERALWLVFDPNGRAQGSVRMPRALEVHQIGSDFVIGTRRDEFDVEHVQRFRLRRLMG